MVRPLPCDSPAVMYLINGFSCKCCAHYNPRIAKGARLIIYVWRKVRNDYNECGYGSRSYQDSAE
jgi:hypothetical protein